MTGQPLAEGSGTDGVAYRVLRRAMREPWKL